MNKSKNVLFAAGIGLALAFTFSCSGDDGSDGRDGSPGITGETGTPGASCVPEDGGAYLIIKCGSAEPDSLPKAMCGIAAYDPKTQLCDSRSLRLYTPVKIGEQIWMKENLNYDAPGSKCYDDDPDNCAIYGRLYDWATAMGIDASCNDDYCSSQIQAKHRGICPGGWHIPSNDDWDILFRFVDGDTGTESPYNSETAGKHLKSVEGWEPYDDIENLDTYGFSALPGGNGYSGGYFGSAGSNGNWWSASEYEDYSDIAYYRHMYYNLERAHWSIFNKSFLLSVRCLQD